VPCLSSFLYLSSVPVPAWSGAVIPLRDTPPIHRSGCSSPTQIREYVNTRCTIHPPIHSWLPNIPCGCCTCLEFLGTQCSVYVVAGFLLSASKDSPVRCVISSLTLNAILELSFCTVLLQQFLWQRHSLILLTYSLVHVLLISYIEDPLVYPVTGSRRVLEISQRVQPQPDRQWQFRYTFQH